MCDSQKGREGDDAYPFAVYHAQQLLWCSPRHQGFHPQWFNHSLSELETNFIGFQGPFFRTFKFLSKKGPWILETNWMPGSSPSLADYFGGESYISLTEFIAGEKKSAESDAHSSVRVSCRWPSHERDFNFFATCAMHCLFEDTQVWPIPWIICTLFVYDDELWVMYTYLKEVTKVVNSRRDK